MSAATGRAAAKPTVQGGAVGAKALRHGRPEIFEFVATEMRGQQTHAPFVGEPAVCAARIAAKLATYPERAGGDAARACR